MGSPYANQINLDLAGAGLQSNLCTAAWTGAASYQARPLRVVYSVVYGLAG
jgi:hypothetical protein